MSVEKNKRTIDGRATYSIRIRLNGIQKRISEDEDGFPFIGNDGKKKAAALEYKLKHTYVPSSADTLTVQHLYEKVIENDKGRIRPSSLYSKKHIIEKHFLPDFKNKLVAKVSHTELLDWQNILKNRGLVYNTLKGIRSYVSGLFDYAEVYYGIPNPFRRVEKIRRMTPKKKHAVWTDEEFKKFIAVVDDAVYSLLFKTLFYCGLRLGEALALGKTDIADTITINKSVTRKETKGKAFVITPPKNESSIRSVYLPLWLKSEFEEYVRNASGTTYIFGGERPLPETSLSRKYKSYIEKAGVKYIRIHDLRHSCASRLLAKGSPVQAVSSLLGHSNSAVTLEVYAHVMPSQLSVLRGIMDEI